MNIIQSNDYPLMFHAVYPDGSLSADYYNKSRAKDYSRRLMEYHVRFPNNSHEEASRSLTGELKLELGS